MSRRLRKERQILKDQDTVEMRRAERKEQEDLAGKKKIEAALTRTQRIAELQKEKSEVEISPYRIARPGKPLKR